MTLRTGETDETGAAATAAAPTSSPPREKAVWYPSIEALRGLAAMSVVAHHTYDLCGSPPTPFGWLLEGLGSWGVYLFFMLSAFLLADRFWRPVNGRDIAAFYVRRIFRIAPAYYVMLFLLMLFFAQPGLLQSRVGWHQMIANLTFTQWLSPSSNLNVNGVLWTLTLEMMLYITLPLLSWLIGRWPVVATIGLIGVGLAYRVWISHWADGVVNYFFGDGQLQSANSRLYLQRQYPGIMPVFVIGIAARYAVEVGALRRWASRPLPIGTFWPVVAALVPSLLWLRGIFRASNFQHTVWFVGFDCVLAVLLVCTTLAGGQTIGEGFARPAGAVGELAWAEKLQHLSLALPDHPRRLRHRAVGQPRAHRPSHPAGHPHLRAESGVRFGVLRSHREARHCSGAAHRQATDGRFTGTDRCRTGGRSRHRGPSARRRPV